MSVLWKRFPVIAGIYIYLLDMVVQHIPNNDDRQIRCKLYFKVCVILQIVQYSSYFYSVTADL